MLIHKFNEGKLTISMNRPTKKSSRRGAGAL